LFSLHYIKNLPKAQREEFLRDTKQDTVNPIMTSLPEQDLHILLQKLYRFLIIRRQPIEITNSIIKKDKTVIMKII